MIIGWSSQRTSSGQLSSSSGSVRTRRTIRSMWQRCSMAIEIKPIRTKADHKAALAEIEPLWDANDNSPEADRLDVLTTLVEAYEASHYPIDPPNPIEAIKFRMEQGGLTRADLVDMIGPRNRVAEVLNGKRALTV